MQWTAEKMLALRLEHLGLILIPIIKRLTSPLWQIKFTILYVPRNDSFEKRISFNCLGRLWETVDEVISFYRTYGEERLVVTNFSDKVRPFSVDVHVEQVMIENMPTDVTALADYSLAPWQAFVVKVSQ